MERIQVLVAIRDKDLASVRAIRKAVFVKEQKVPEELEEEHEEESKHFLALYDNIPAGTGRYRLLEEKGLAKFERVCTLNEFRRKGVAFALLQTMQKDCQKKYPDHLPIMHAQTGAIDLYTNLGWVVLGEIFQEGSIHHQLMIYPPQDPSKLKCLSDPETPRLICTYFKSSL